MMWWIVGAAVAAWLIVGLAIACYRIDWTQIYVAKWQLLDAQGMPRRTSTATGVAFLLFSLATCWPRFLWGWRMDAQVADRDRRDKAMADEELERFLDLHDVLPTREKAGQQTEAT